MRVSALDDPPDSYHADGWLPGTAREAGALAQKPRRELGFAAAVYPVVVLCADFPQRQLYVGDVCVVSGHELADWLRSRPADPLNEHKRKQVANWVGSPPQRRRQRQRRRWITLT
jgi:hypothetical protein